jgi:hypothetical protein
MRCTFQASAIGQCCPMPARTATYVSERERQNVLKLLAVAGASIIPRLWVSTLSQVLPVLLAAATALALLPIEKMCDHAA